MDLSQLNEEQRRAVTLDPGAALILAGAGSGKTRALTHRIAYLIQALNVAPWRIMAVTFTNKAAGEMARRVEELVGVDRLDAQISTFHSACVRILRVEARLAHRTPNFVIYDGSDQVQLIKRILKKLDLDPNRYPPRELSNRISRIKNRMAGPGSGSGVSEFGDRDPLAEVFPRYEDALAANNAFDFDDLLNAVVKLFNEYPETLKKYGDRFQHILVDEFQDINAAQYELVRLLARGHGSIWVVGDDDQSIYRWRGSNTRYLMEFERDFPGCEEIKFERNYRSTRRILDVANAVIAGNQGRKPKRLWTDSELGEEPVALSHGSDRDEAAEIAAEIRRAVRQGGAEYGAFAILYRTNGQSRLFEEAFMQLDIPYQVVGATAFYQRKEIKDAAAYLRCLVNPRDKVSLLRIINSPPRGIGAVTQDAVEQALEGGLGWGELGPLVDDMGLRGRGRTALVEFLDMMSRLREQAAIRPVNELARLALEESGYTRSLRAEDSIEAESRLSNIEQFVNSAREYVDDTGDTSLDGFLERITLVSDADALEDGVDRVRLLTLHCAKGLEFDRVVIAGMEETIFPHQRSCNDQAELDEERRLLYVGVTRARKSLALSWAKRRMNYGTSIAMAPSRFLREIPADQIRGLSAASGSRAAAPPPGRQGSDPSFGRPAQSRPAPNFPAARRPIQARTQVGDYRAGDKVAHKVFGPGMVVSVKGSGPEAEISIAFENGGVRNFVAGFAPIKKTG